MSWAGATLRRQAARCLWLGAGLLCSCSVPGIRPEGRDVRLGGEIPADHEVVRERAEAWLGRNGYRIVSGGRSILAERREPTGSAGMRELVVLSLALEERGGGITYAQIVATPYLEDGGRTRVEVASLRVIRPGEDVHALWEAISPRPRNPPG